MDRRDVHDALAALDTARAAVAALPLDRLSATDLLTIYEHRQHGHRQDTAFDHTVLATLTQITTCDDFGGTTLRDVLAHRLHLDLAAATARLADATQLGPRWSFTGERLDPALPHTAAALARAAIDPAHVAVIQKFVKKLPAWVDETTRAEAEADLARLAATMCPTDLRHTAKYLLEVIDPDGAEPDYDDQQAKRSLHIGRQRPDGTVPITGVLDPVTAALLDQVIAKWAAPGQNVPTDPGAAEALHQEILGGDPRTQEQRQHDALSTALGHTVGSGALGHHNGLPATIIVTTTLRDLEHAAANTPTTGEGDTRDTGKTGDTGDTGVDTGDTGETTGDTADIMDRDAAVTWTPIPDTDRAPTPRYATTAGGTRLSMRDVIRLAGQAGHHYLAVFDDHTEEILYFGRAKRCATAAQRLALYARDKGCTRPGCTTPPNRCQAHHADRDWSHGGLTNINDRSLACPPDNNLIEHTGWTTRRRNGRTEWMPPPQLDTGQTRINNYHHPHRYLTDRTNHGGGRDDDGSAPSDPGGDDGGGPG